MFACLLFVCLFVSWPLISVFCARLSTGYRDIVEGLPICLFSLLTAGNNSVPSDLCKAQCAYMVCNAWVRHFQRPYPSTLCDLDPV